MTFDQQPKISVRAADLVRERFVPTLVYVRESADFHTRLCVYNYFSETHPDVKTGATVYAWFFSQQGQLLATREFELGYQGQLQYDLSELAIEFEGTAGVSLVPHTIPEFKHAGVGTGYYVYYYDNFAHADFSHEWDPMRFERRNSPPWLCVLRPKLFPDTQLIVMNSYYGEDPDAGSTRWNARIRDGRGRVLADRQMPVIPPRGSVRLRLDEIFPNLRELGERSETIAVEAIGTNMQGPFSWVSVPGGDFNIHHFC